MQMVDVHLPTTDGRQLVLPRYTQPDPDHQLPLPTAQAETTGPTPASNLRLNPPLSSPSARGLVVPTFGFREPEINELCAFWPRVAEVGVGSPRQSVGGCVKARVFGEQPS